MVGLLLLVPYAAAFAPSSERRHSRNQNPLPALPPPPEIVCYAHWNPEAVNVEQMLELVPSMGEVSLSDLGDYKIHDDKYLAWGSSTKYYAAVYAYLTQCAKLNQSFLVGILAEVRYCAALAHAIADCIYQREDADESMQWLLLEYGGYAVMAYLAASPQTIAEVRSAIVQEVITMKDKKWAATIAKVLLSNQPDSALSLARARLYAVRETLIDDEDANESTVLAVAEMTAKIHNNEHRAYQLAEKLCAHPHTSAEVAQRLAHSPFYSVRRLAAKYA